MPSRLAASLLLPCGVGAGVSTNLQNTGTCQNCKFNQDGAEGETRTPTEKPPLDPEPSASTSSATSA